MGIHRGALAAVAVGVVAGTSWAGVAFACTPRPAVYSVVPESASPGETVTVRGESPDPVEIRWNGVRGRVLAVAGGGGGGAFSVPVQIPTAEAGVYSMTIVSPNAGINRTAIEVTGVASSAPATTTKLWPVLAHAPSSSAPASGGVDAVGITLLSVGLIGLGAGATAAVARRRRAPAR